MSPAGLRSEDIHAHRKHVRSLVPRIEDFEVLMPRFGMTLKPWDEWRKARGVPFWWTAYNKIKHARDSEYARANLKNALNAVAGLFVVVLYLYRNQANLGELLPSTQLLRADNAHTSGIQIGNLATVYQRCRKPVWCEVPRTDENPSPLPARSLAIVLPRLSRPALDSRRPSADRD